MKVLISGVTQHLVERCVLFVFVRVHRSGTLLVKKCMRL